MKVRLFIALFLHEVAVVASFRDNRTEDGSPSSSPPASFEQISVTKLQIHEICEVTAKSHSDSYGLLTNGPWPDKQLEMVTSNQQQQQRSSVELWVGNDDSLNSVLLSAVNIGLRNCSFVIGYDEEFEGSAVLEGLLNLSNLRQVIKLVTVQDFDSMIWEASTCRAYIFLQRHPKILETFCNYDDYIWDFQGRYILVGLSKEDILKLLTSKKLSKTENLVGIVKYRAKGEWGLYTNRIITDTGLKFITTWKENQFTIQDPILFPDKLSNFQGAVMKVTAFDWRPSVMYEWDDVGQIRKRYGRDVMVVRGLAEALNATLVFNDASQKELWGFRSENGSWTGLMGIIQRGEADVGIANLFISNVTFRMLVADFSVPFDIEVTCFLSRKPKPLPKWERVLYPFEYTTWVSIIIGFVVSGPLLYVLSRLGQASGGERHDFLTLNFSYLYAFGMQLMEGQAITPIRRGTQVFVCFLWLYATIITTGYSSNLTALLTVARRPPTIDTIKHLYESHLEVGGMGAIFGTALASSKNPYLKGLSHRYSVYNGQAQRMYSELRKDNTVIIAGWNVLQYMVEMEFTHNHASTARIIKETFSPFGIGVITQRGSPLKGKFDVFINRMVESGLVRYWFLESLRIAKQENDARKMKQMNNNEDQMTDTLEMIEIEDGGVQSLGFDHVQGFFFTLGLGYFVSLVAFFVETRLSDGLAR